MPYRLAMMTRRLRAPLRVAGLLLLLVAAAAGIALAVRPTAAGIPLDPTIPNEQALIARGLSGVPSPGQPTAPIVVDRVVTDGTTTYVQFHSPAALGRLPDVIPMLYDDTGALINDGGGASTGTEPLDWTRFLPPWVPWHPPLGPVHGVATLGPLPPTARAAVLRFQNGETVRVPLNLSALRHVHAYTGPLVSRAGLQLRIAAARDTGLVLGYGLPANPMAFGEVRGVTLRDARGRAMPVTMQSGACTSGGGLPDVQLACRQVWTYPLQPRGARLTLLIRSFAASAGSPGLVSLGPWHLSFVIP